MREGFVGSVLEKMLQSGILARTDSVLAVCANHAERALFQKHRFTCVTISNLDVRGTHDPSGSYAWNRDDVRNLGFPDAAFDFAFVSDGLHHCDSPHRALLEMYRVARKGVIVFESRDNLLMRAALRLGMVAEYELIAVANNSGRSGGVNNSSIPNYIYRWTEREFEKTILAFNPTARHKFMYFYGLSLPPASRFARSRVRTLALLLLAPVIRVLARIFSRQMNSFSMVVLKPSVPSDLWPWLELKNGMIIFRSEDWSGSPD